MSSDDRTGFRSHTPPTPLRHSIGNLTQTSLSLAHANPAFSYEQADNGKSKHVSAPVSRESQACLINSSNDIENERIYLNQINESHQYASIDLNDSIISESTSDEQV